MTIINWQELTDNGEHTGIYEVTVKTWLGGERVYHGNPLTGGFFDLATGRKWRGGAELVSNAIHVDGLRSMVLDLKKPKLRGVD